MSRIVVLRLALLLGSSLFSLLLLLAFYGWRVHKDPFPRTDLRYEGDWPLASDPLLGYAAIPNGASQMRKLKLNKDYAIYTDADGARVNRPGEQKPDRVDIMAIGGSCVYGYCLNNEDTFPELLAREFGVTSVNLSQVGYGTVQSVKQLEKHMERRPKVVIYGFIDDHLNRNLNPCAPSAAPYCLEVPYLQVQDVQAPQWRAPANQNEQGDLGWRFYREILTQENIGFNDIRWRIRADLARFQNPSLTNPSQNEADKQTAMMFLLDYMADICDQIGAHLIVMHMPYFIRDEPNPPPPALMAALDDRITFLDLTEVTAAYKAAGDTPPLGIPTDGHPDIAGHRMMADELSEIIRTQNMLSPR